MRDLLDERHLASWTGCELVRIVLRFMVPTIVALKALCVEVSHQGNDRESQLPH